MSPLGITLHDLQVLFVLSGALRFAGAFISLRIHEPSAKPAGVVMRGVYRRATRWLRARQTSMPAPRP